MADSTLERGGRNQRRVFDALTATGGPMTAYQLLDRLRPEGIGAPPSVYRALNQLVAAGRVHRLETLNAYIACAHPHRFGGPAFAICDVCHQVTEVDDGEILSAIGDWAGRTGFHIGRLAIEMIGRCAACALVLSGKVVDEGVAGEGVAGEGAAAEPGAGGGALEEEATSEEATGEEATGGASR